MMEKKAGNRAGEMPSGKALTNQPAKRQTAPLSPATARLQLLYVRQSLHAGGDLNVINHEG